MHQYGYYFEGKSLDECFGFDGYSIGVLVS